MRKTDGFPVVKLGAWDEPVLSPDGRRVLAVEGSTVGKGKPSVVPIGVGEIQTFDVERYRTYSQWDGCRTGRVFIMERMTDMDLDVLAGPCWREAASGDAGDHGEVILL